MGEGVQKHEKSLATSASGDQVRLGRMVLQAFHQALVAVTFKQSGGLSRLQVKPLHAGFSPQSIHVLDMAHATHSEGLLIG